MLKLTQILLFILLPVLLTAQVVDKKNYTKIVNQYYDYNKVNLQASGHYYKDELGETTERHGKWKFYDRLGILQEERNYYRDLLEGKVVLYYANKTMSQEGYFKAGRQDSVYREWYENGQLKTEGEYLRDQAVGLWTNYYFDGHLKSEEGIIDGETNLSSYFAADSLHTQTILDGNGELFNYYTTGAIKEYYQYENGLKNGVFEEYSIYGYMLLNGNFVANQKDGEWNFFYYTGEKEKTSNYKSGVLHGAYAYYYDSG
ncbi:MAG: antitoxin component YwqK of YwqJK toxin-antitoxin module, partial [Lentimonas sp.]